MVYTKSFIPGQGGSTTFQSITIFGHVWNKQLKNLLKNSLSLRVVAKQLGLIQKLYSPSFLSRIQHSWSTKQILLLIILELIRHREKAVKRKESEDTLDECGMSIKTARNKATHYTLGCIVMIGSG
jgi:hypothetical protein